MTILDYYLNQQKNTMWKTKFFSTSDGQSGKNLPYYNTNYRRLFSFFIQMEMFENKNGLQRSEWNSKMASGQEKDKHRITNMINANFLNEEPTGYYFTAEGLTALDIYHSDKIKDKDKWILLFILLLPFGKEDRPLSIIATVKDFFSTLNLFGYSDDYIMEMLKKALNTSKKQNLFGMDIFWLLTFYKDSTFIKNYSKSSEKEKKELFDYVIKESNKEKSDDLIAHKFVSCGVYSCPSFVDDLKVIYFTKIALCINKTEEKLFFIDFINTLFNSYNTIFNNDKDVCLKFLKNNQSVYLKCFNEIKEAI